MTNLRDTPGGTEVVSEFESLALPNGTRDVKSPEFIRVLRNLIVSFWREGVSEWRCQKRLKNPTISSQFWNMFMQLAGDGNELGVTDDFSAESALSNCEVFTLQEKCKVGKITSSNVLQGALVRVIGRYL